MLLKFGYLKIMSFLEMNFAIIYKLKWNMCSNLVWKIA